MRELITHRPLKHIVVDVFGTTVRASESKPLAITVALFISELGRSTKKTVPFFLTLLLLLGSEVTWVESWTSR